jgi:hypothetical protein
MIRSSIHVLNTFFCLHTRAKYLIVNDKEVYTESKVYIFIMAPTYPPTNVNVQIFFLSTY